LIFFEVIFCESEQDGRLSHTRVTNNQQFKQMVVLVRSGHYSYCKKPKLIKRAKEEKKKRRRRKKEKSNYNKKMRALLK